MVGSADVWAGVGTTIIGVALTVLVAFIAASIRLFIHEVNTRFDEMKEQIKINGRHLDSTISTVWLQHYRLTSLEDFLDDTTEYRPVRMVPLDKDKPL